MGIRAVRSSRACAQNFDAAEPEEHDRQRDLDPTEVRTFVLSVRPSHQVYVCGFQLAACGGTLPHLSDHHKLFPAQTMDGKQGNNLLGIGRAQLNLVEDCQHLGGSSLHGMQESVNLI